ncbi:flagellar protein FlgN [Papillibacter cinnamivorans]|uniref:FlgN protein n=1 Tax=Papillibacter cinnamivorans DSM 12816 TaxID=1122930 RepID=A0A1W1YH94_9FIRM|nr:flagellar protein FlgN [Papillibacter cinnamivorans]SMC35529.1 FlgN protein [Papillibacter cinnamivorans DSM 12816]
MDKTCFGELFGLLSLEKDVLLKLLSASSRKKAAVISGDLELLKVSLREEETLTEELAGLENDRAALSEKLSLSFGAGGRKLSLKDLADLTEDPELKKKMLSVRDELGGLVGIQKKNNRVNRELILRKQKYTSEMLRAMLRPEGTGAVYNCSGKIGDGPGDAGIFDRCV